MQSRAQAKKLAVSLQPVASPIVETYSRLAEQYDEEANQSSCWGRSAAENLASLALKPRYRVVADIGCGTGRSLVHLASAAPPDLQLIGIDPAENMCRLAKLKAARHPQIRIAGGSFERMPLATASVDYLFSIHAFHWVSDLNAAVQEISRVLKPDADMDLFFIGRNNGREFIQKTTPVFLKYLGPAWLLDSTRLRKQLSREAALELFAGTFGASGVSVEESYVTYFDTLEGHWGWWVRIEGHFLRLPPEKKLACDREVRAAIQSLQTEQGIPYRIHQLHVRLRRD